MKKIALLCVCAMALMAMPVDAGMKFSLMPKRQVEVASKESLLKSRNVALEQALTVHNLLNQIPSLEEMLESADLIEKNEKIFTKALKNMRKCGEQALGAHYKNAGAVLDKAIEEYREEVEKVEQEIASSADPESFIPVSVQMRLEMADAKRKMNRTVFDNIAKNPKKYGAEPNRRTGVAAVSDEEEENDFNLLENIVQSADNVHNLGLSKKDLERNRSKLTDQFVKELAAVGLTYPDLDFRSAASFTQVRADLKKMKNDLVAEAEDYIRQLDEQDEKHPEIAEKRSYRSANKKNMMAEIEKEYPEAMNMLVQIDQMTPQQQQRLIIEALKKDVNGTVYLTETNMLEIDRKMEEVRAHRAMMKHLKKSTQELLPTTIPDIDVDLCKV